MSVFSSLVSPLKNNRGGVVGKLILLLVIIVALFALYTWITLSFTYSKGSRAGFLQKFSNRGWICKTWEGELVTGAMIGNQEKFSFSVRDEELAKKISSSIGKRVEIDYDQHIGVPTKCFAETEYYANSIKQTNENITIQKELVPAQISQ